VKRLTLMRHGDAHWKDPGLPDMERPLSRRGSAGAEAMGRRLLELKFIPDLLLELSLPARRLVREEALYLASAGDILKVVHATGPRVAHLMVVTHNPGVSELIERLAPDARIDGLGTAAVCSMTFSSREWSALAAAALCEVQQESPPRGLFGLFS
jgi:phosphohistidine phosphatase